MYRTIVLVILVVAVPACRTADTVSDGEFGRPDLEYDVGLTRVAGIAELTGDRVVVVAKDPPGPSLIDLRGGPHQPIGRAGQGPGEWSSIGTVLSAGGDTSLLYDSGRRALLTAVGPSIVGVPARPHGDIRARDAQGHVFFVGFSSAIAGNAFAAGVWEPGAKTEVVGERRDSNAVVRERLADGTLDTLGWSRLETGWTQLERIKPDGTIEHGGTFPDAASWPSTQHDWVAFGLDGTIAIIRLPEFQVEWLLPEGRRTMGAPIPYDPALRSGPVRSGTSYPAMVDSRRELWVNRRLADTTTVAYDVIDTTGAVVRRVRLPDHTRLIGFGIETAYLVRVDQDDLEYLQRYRLP